MKVTFPIVVDNAQAATIATLQASPIDRRTN
jgi:hypothetical protein